MEPYYLVNTYCDNNFVASSDVFYSKTDAVEFKKFLDEKNTFDNKLVYCVIVDDTETKFDNFDNFDMILKIYDYDGGYLLKCPEDNTYYGMDKYEEGKWDKELSGWVFPLECDIDKLGKLGIFTNEQDSKTISTTNLSNTSNTSSNTSNTSNTKYNLRKRDCINNLKRVTFE
jgi:hypothetical protein